MKLATAANYQDHGYITAEYDDNNKMGSATAIINNEAHSFGMEISNRYTLVNSGSVSTDMTRTVQSGDYVRSVIRTYGPGSTDPDFVLVKNFLMPIGGSTRTVNNPPEYLEVVTIGQTRYVVFKDFPETETINIEFVSASEPE